MAISKIGSRAIIDGSVLAADFAPGTVTGAKLAGSIANDKLANSTITIGGEALSLGATDNSLNLIDWQSKVTSDGSTVTTMVAGRGYFVDNSSAAGLVKLPASATIGQQVAIKDYAGNFGTNNLTIQRNSHKIQGNTIDATVDTNRASLTAVYVDSTKGWIFTDESNVSDLQKALHTQATGGTVTTTGDFKVHTFTGDGNFVVSAVGNAPVSGAGPGNVDYLVIAGGGGGYCSVAGGGGGGGGHRTTFPSPGCNAGAFPISAQTYPITVGGGGAGSSNGANSVFSTITSAGGGTGGNYNSGGANGGSGGGGGGTDGSPSSAGPAGSGNTPPVSPPQGNNGGATVAQPCGQLGGSGGGGIGGAGSNSPTQASPSLAGSGGAGGNGGANSITASSVTRAGGGGGGNRSYNGPNPGPGTGGAAGPGGGGKGGGTDGTSTPGTVNTGGGGGGKGFGTFSPNVVGTGGSGVVIIRYKYQN